MKHYVDQNIFQENGFNALRRFYRYRAYVCCFCGYSAVGEFLCRERLNQEVGVPALFVEPSTGKLCCYKPKCQEALMQLTKKKFLVPLVEILAQQEGKRNHFRETAKTKLAFSPR